MKVSRLETLTVRGRQCAVHVWGEGGRKLFMLHGWMDGGATFQFLVDALKGNWQVIAPDWRGFGASAPNDGPYWYPDYLGDLDALLEQYSAEEAVLLLGHSMGGNVAGIYAGVRPERVAKLVLVEGVGLPPADPCEAPTRYRRWLNELRVPPKMREYANHAELAARLREKNPRLTAARADYLAAELGKRLETGRIAFAADPWHRVVNPVLYRIEESKACWREITAPVLWLMGADSHVLRRFADHPEEYRSRLSSIRDVREAVLADAGHNLHHDQPERLAALVEEFLAE